MVQAKESRCFKLLVGANLSLPEGGNPCLVLLLRATPLTTIST